MFGYSLWKILQKLIRSSHKPTWDSTVVLLPGSASATELRRGHGQAPNRQSWVIWSELWRQEYRGKKLNILAPYHYLSLVITTYRHLSLPIFEPRARPCSSPGAARVSWRVPCSCGAPVVGDGGIIGASAIPLRGPGTASVPCGGVHRGGGDCGWMMLDIRCWCGIERFNDEILIWFLVWLL